MFDPVQRRVDAAESDIPPDKVQQLLRYRHTVGFIAEPDDCEQNHEFHFAEITAGHHFLKYSEQICATNTIRSQKSSLEEADVEVLILRRTLPSG